MLADFDQLLAIDPNQIRCGYGTGRLPTSGTPKAEITALVAPLKNIVTVLAQADAEDKRPTHAELGVNLTWS